MGASIALPPHHRNALLAVYRTAADPQARLRAHILLLLDRGLPWADIAALLYTSSATIGRCRRAYQRDGVSAATGRRRGRRRWWAAPVWAGVAVWWVTTFAPALFGFARSRWSCEAVAVALRDDYRVRVSRETVRLWLRAAGLVWRRPRPVLRPRDPDREAKLAGLRALLHGLPADETAVFMDEVDINLNPEVGCQWMRRGEQAAVETPGTNEKRYLAGSIHWRTGEVLVTEGRRKEGRSAALFLRHLDDLRRTFRRYKVIHVVCDNARSHDCKAVARYLSAWGRRVVLHYLPKYAPECNPIERVWWRLHEAVTRNHRCDDMDELLDLTFRWLRSRGRFRVESSVYDVAA